jgi:hypothetical protein
MHFFAEATATVADTNGKKDCGEAAQAALEITVTWLLAGIGLSLGIDRVLLRSGVLAAAVAGQHGHSHDCNDLQSTTSETSTEDNATTGHDASGVATVIVAVLLGFHAALEGVSLAFEPNLAALRAGFIPLLVHKFFDGLLLGIQAARSPGGAGESRHGRRLAKTEDPLELEANSAGQPKSTLSRGFYCFALLWSCVTPAALLAIIAAGQTGSQSASAGENGTKDGGMGPRFQCLGAGTFVYVAMMEVLSSEFRSLPTAPRRLHKSSTAIAPWSPIVKLAVVVVGCLMVRLIEGGHHHHH